MLTGRVVGRLGLGLELVLRGRDSTSAAIFSFNAFASSSRVPGVEIDATRERSGVRMKLLDHGSRELGMVSNSTNGDTTVRPVDWQILGECSTESPLAKNGIG